MTLRDIVVGLDGSSSSVDALRWASGLAGQVSAQVRILTTWHMPVFATIPSIIEALPSPALMASHAGQQIDKACAEAAVEGLPARIVEGDAGAFLAAETKVADLVVVGRSGNGQRNPVRLLTELMLGSTARYCLHHAHGPVAAIPANTTWVPNPTVVVGVDGSPSSIAALRWAVDTLPAAATIHAVRAIPPYLEGLLALDRGVMDRVVAVAQIELDEAISTVVNASNRAETSITATVVVENARHALTQPAFAADLIVVGSRSRNLTLTPLLGSTSDHVVRRAACPVVVIPPKKGITQ